ncbi:hypothetical protein [Streptomyces sp. NPDC051211]|uniref:hypothetical protein n=1 Tax=Streptomyces sp. NPDC051211 TaxID=3154643 RepID=UPI003450E1C3
MKGGNGMTDGQWDDRQANRQGAGIEDALRAALRAAPQACDRPAPGQEGAGAAAHDGAARAVAAFRVARDEGLHASARTRRRDDWRPAAERRLGRSLRTALASLLASVTLGGVAIAAGALPTPFRETPAPEPKPRRSTSVPLPPPKPAGSPVPATPSVDRETRPAPRPAKPATAQDHEALCSAYEKVKGRGKAAESAAWQRLVTAAGGEQGVPGYCGERPEPGRDGHPGRGPGDGADGDRSTHPTPRPPGKPAPDRP